LYSGNILNPVPYDVRERETGVLFNDDVNAEDYTAWDRRKKYEYGVMVEG
jgi:hypothetical protein